MVMDRLDPSVLILKVLEAWCEPAKFLEPDGVSEWWCFQMFGIRSDNGEEAASQIFALAPDQVDEFLEMLDGVRPQDVGSGR